MATSLTTLPSPTSTITLTRTPLSPTSLSITYSPPFTSPTTLSTSQSLSLSTLWSSRPPSALPTVAVRWINSTTLYVGLPPTCEGYFMGGREVGANPDISGLGVLVAWLRISGMVVLFLMLMVALIPTHMSALSLMIEDVSRFRDMRPANGIPAGCLWKVLGDWTPPQEQLGQFKSPAQRYFPKGNIPVDGQAVLSTIILFFTFVWRLMSMFDISRDKFQHMFRDRPSRFFETKIQKYMASTGSLLRRFLRWSLRVTLITLYLIHTLSWDALDSYAGSIWLITINLSVGTGQLIQIRSQLPPTIREEEATWTFGQIMPLALLALPIIAVAEDMLTKPPNPRSPRTDSSVSTSSLPNNHHTSTIPDDTKYPTTQYHPLPPPNNRTNSPTAPSPGPSPPPSLPIQAHLLTTKLYTLLFWETHAMLAFTAIWLPISRISFGKGENFWLNYMFIPMTIWVLGGTIVVFGPLSGVFGGRRLRGVMEEAGMGLGVKGTEREGSRGGRDAKNKEGK